MSAAGRGPAAITIDANVSAAPRPPAVTAVVSGDGAAAALALLRLESEIRSIATVAELRFLIANETIKYTRARQVFVVGLGAKVAPHILAATSLAVVDRHAPLLQVLEHAVTELAATNGLGKHHEFDLSALSGAAHHVTASYPMRFMLWMPLRRRDGHVFAGLLQAREIPWSESDIAVTQHLAGAYAHALTLLDGAKPGLRLGWPRRRWTWGLAALIAAAGAIPVPMTALAPMEVAPRAPALIASAIDGTIEDVLIEPNAAVAAGQPLVRFADTVLRNRYDVADREARVAEAKLKKAEQLAFDDQRGLHDMALARAELAVRRAERDFARDLLAKTEIRAPGAGVALFADKRDIVGRPVTVGERLMEIADARRFEFAVDMPVTDAIVLATGARVKIFLDADPLRPVEARIARFDYRARTLPGGGVAFRVTAEPSDPSAEPPRLGVRGTAQVFSTPVPAAFYVFRRPFTATRQWLGL